MSQTPLFFDAKKYPQPPVQAAISFGIGLLMMLVVRLVEGSGAMEIDKEFYWVVSGAFILLFGVYNSLLSLGTVSYGRYLQFSLLSFVLLMIASGLLAYAFSGLHIFDAGSFQSIYTILIMSFFALHVLALFIKRIAMMLHRDEENQG